MSDLVNAAVAETKTAARRTTTSRTARIFLEDTLPVRLIETPKAEFLSCQRHEQIAELAVRFADYDHLPVVEARGSEGERVVGLLNLARCREAGDLSDTVAAYAEPLSEDNLISADESILRFLRGAAVRECRLVVSGSAISGLVTLSDVEQLPVRACLFALVTHLETVMADLVRRKYGDVSEWIEQLDEKRRNDIAQRIADAKAKNGHADPVLATYLSEKGVLLSKCSQFPFDRQEFKKAFWKIGQLRNELAHAKDYANTRPQYVDLCKTVALIESWIGKLEAWLEEGADPPASPAP